MAQSANPSRDAVRDVVPDLIGYSERVLFGEIWERPGLKKRDRSLIVVATLIALDRTAQLPFHLARALGNGVRRDELAELITHLAFYAGWPCAASAVSALRALDGAAAP